MKQTRRLLCVFLCLCCVAFCAAPAAFAADNGVRNVIFMIGDGMGYNHLKLAEEQGYEIFMDDQPDLLGWSRTRSANKEVTDSAAGATALACGVRTNNKMLAVFPEEEKRETLQPRSVTENAILHGMKTGIVTTDYTSGATPSGFSVHVLSRDDAESITAQQLSGNIDLILGKKEDAAEPSAVEEAGFRYLETRADLVALQVGARAFGQFGSSIWKLNLPAEKPSLEEMCATAVSLLTTGNPKGFFLMVEGAHIDKNADDSKNGLKDYPEKRANVAEAVKTFDNAVRAAVDFAKKDGRTLVIITADHETGNLYPDGADSRMTFHSASHTSANVPVFVYGAQDLFENGAEMDNTAIVNLIAEKLGWTERFPIEDPVGFVAAPPAPEAPQTNDEKPVGFLLRLWQWICDFFKWLFG